MHTEIDGHKIFYSDGAGRFAPEQKSVVFIHGAGLDHTVWLLPARYFARHGFNVVSPDLPGHGRSKGNPLNSIDSLAVWIGKLLESLGIQAAAIVGHSMGSLVALTLAGSQPQRVRSLALLGTSVPMPVSEQLLTAAEANSHAAIDMSNTWSHSYRGQMGGNENPGVWMLGAAQRLLERAGDAVYFSDFTACNNFTAGEDHAAKVRCPTLILSGSADLMTPPVKARDIAKIIPDCRLKVLAECGHSMMSEQPEQVLNELIRIV